MDWKRIAASALMLGVLAVPASAASITPQTTMKEIRDDPDIKASGLYTYTYVWERDCEMFSTSRDDETLTKVVGKTSAEACAAGLNYLAQVYHDGTRVTYPLYSEEEIAAKLGSPEELAAQFESTDTAKKVGGSKALAVIGLCFADLFAGLFFVLLAGFGLVMAAAALCFAALAVCLLGGWNIAGLIPAMPYWCGAILALSFAALTVLLVIGCVYYAAFLRQLVRSFGRFQHNALASASGEAALPALAINPQFSAKTRRRLRAIALISLALFAACFVLSYVVCALLAGSFQFWHAWGWFRN